MSRRTVVPITARGRRPSGNNQGHGNNQPRPQTILSRISPAQTILSRISHARRATRSFRYGQQSAVREEWPAEQMAGRANNQPRDTNKASRPQSRSATTAAAEQFIAGQRPADLVWAALIPCADPANHSAVGYYNDVLRNDNNQHWQEQRPVIPMIIVGWSPDGTVMVSPGIVLVGHIDRFPDRDYRVPYRARIISSPAATGIARSARALCRRCSRHGGFASATCRITPAKCVDWWCAVVPRGRFVLRLPGNHQDYVVVEPGNRSRKPLSNGYTGGQRQSPEQVNQTVTSAISTRCSRGFDPRTLTSRTLWCKPTVRLQGNCLSSRGYQVSLGAAVVLKEW